MKLKNFPLKAIFLVLGFLFLVLAFSSYLVPFSIIGNITPQVGTLISTDPVTYQNLDGEYLTFFRDYYNENYPIYFRLGTTTGALPYSRTWSTSFNGSSCVTSNVCGTGFETRIAISGLNCGLTKYGKQWLDLYREPENCQTKPSRVLIAKVPVIIDDPLCNTFYSQGKLLASAVFTSGQTISKATIKESFKGQELITFCYSFPAQYFDFDSNQTLNYSTIPYDYVNAQGYFTVPSNSAIKVFGIIDRPPQIGYTCDINQYVDSQGQCKPVPAFIDFCSGQISADQQFCLNETKRKCVDDQGALVVNATYNIDSGFCEVPNAISCPKNGEIKIENNIATCVFTPNYSCEKGTLTTDPNNGEQYCKVLLPNVIEQQLIKINFLYLFIGIAAIIFGLVIKK